MLKTSKKMAPSRRPPCKGVSSNTPFTLQMKGKNMVNNKNLVLCLSYELSRYLSNQLEQYIDHYLNINGDDEENERLTPRSS